MKKIILPLILCSVLVGCSSTNPSSSQTSSSQPSSSEPSSSETSSEDNGSSSFVGPTSVGLIGSFEGSEWTVETPFTTTDSIIWTLADITLKEGDQLKIRINHNWDTCYGYNDITTTNTTFSDEDGNNHNIGITVSGDYTITFNAIEESIDFNLDKENITPEQILAAAISSTKGNSHKVKINETLMIKYPNEKYVVDLYQRHELDLGYYYGEENELSHSNLKYGEFADLIKGTNEINENTLKVKNGNLQHFYKDFETGYAIVEEINVYNELNKLIVVNQDISTGELIPVIYDDLFANPFDYIPENSFVLNTDGTISLDSAKAKSVLQLYGAIGINDIESATISLDENYRMKNITFVIPDLVEATYTRTNEISVEFYGYEDAKFQHVETFKNDNPALVEMFAKYDNLENFTYVKEVEIDNLLVDHLEGYFTKDIVFFHHGYIDDDRPLMWSDNYDYKCVLNTEGVYDVYEYVFDDVESYHWLQVYASETMPYSIPTFEEIGPSFFNLSPAIFKQVDKYTYTVEDLLISTVGQYFDFNILPTESSILETTTTGLTITLDENNNLVEVIATSYFQAAEYTFTYNYENIGTTVIPAWIDGPIESA